jgi:hypothetical protein
MSTAHPASLQKGYVAGPGDRRLRTSVLFAVAAQSLFLVFFLPLSLPAFILAKEGRHLVIAALLAGFAAFAYFAFWFEILAELGTQQAPWS